MEYTIYLDDRQGKGTQETALSIDYWSVDNEGKISFLFARIAFGTSGMKNHHKLQVLILI